MPDNLLQIQEINEALARTQRGLLNAALTPDYSAFRAQLAALRKLLAEYEALCFPQAATEAPVTAAADAANVALEAAALRYCYPVKPLANLPVRTVFAVSHPVGEVSIYRLDSHDEPRDLGHATFLRGTNESWPSAQTTFSYAHRRLVIVLFEPAFHEVAPLPDEPLSNSHTTELLRMADGRLSASMSLPERMRRHQDMGPSPLRAAYIAREREKEFESGINRYFIPGLKATEDE